MALKAAVTDDTAMLSLGKCSPPDILSLSDSIRAFWYYYAAAEIRFDFLIMIDNNTNFSTNYFSFILVVYIEIRFIESSNNKRVEFELRFI